jgi:hypothetical protein
MPPLHGLYCCITSPDGHGIQHDWQQSFDAAAKALEWIEVDCQSFGTARQFRDDQALLIGVGWFRNAGTGFGWEGFGSLQPAKRSLDLLDRDRH